MSLSLVPMLLAGQSISDAARKALRQGRLQDAVTLLMHEHGLTCREAGDLLDICAC
jgi:predicted RNA binding protein with dsRBD fold (UPF0201 family)